MAISVFRIKGYDNVNYRRLRSQQERAEFPPWFNHLIRQGFISAGCAEAARSDNNILRRIESIFIACQQAPQTIAQYNPITIPQGQEIHVGQLLAGSANQTELSIIYLEKNCQHLIVTAVEEKGLSIPQLPTALPLPLGQYETRDIKPAFTSPPPLGGIIIRGTIEKTVSQGRITLWKRRGRYHLFYIPPWAAHIHDGDKVNLLIDGPHLEINTSTGVKLGEIEMLDAEGNPAGGFTIERLGPYLPWMHGLTGYFYKCFNSAGQMKIGTLTLTHPALSEEQGRIIFCNGDGFLFHVTPLGDVFLQRFTMPTRSVNPRQVLPAEEAGTFTGSLVRIVSDKGEVSLGGRIIVLDKTIVPTGSHIQFELVDGEIVRITHAMSFDIPLSAIKTTRFFDLDGKNPEYLRCADHRVSSMFAGRSGYWEVPQSEKGTVLYFGQRKFPLKGHFPGRFARIIDGVLVGIRYYNNPAATPDQPPDDEDLFKRLYINDTLTLACADSFQPQHFANIKKRDRIKITHLRIPRTQSVEVNPLGIKKQHLLGYAGKYAIVIISSRGIRTIKIYDQPETDPSKKPLITIKL